jgi:hypothetical protein
MEFPIKNWVLPEDMPSGSTQPTEGDMAAPIYS